MASTTPPSSDGVHRPLSQTFPEYCVVKHLNGTHEFRVEAESYFRSRNAPTSYFTGPFEWGLVLILPTLGAAAWHTVCMLSGYVYGTLRSEPLQATQVLWESAIVLPSKDIQLEVHRGLGGRSIFVRRWAVPASTVSAVIINEGLYGWNVRYYLAVLTKAGETQSLQVLFENQLPRMPVLRDAYHKLQELLFDGS